MKTKIIFSINGWKVSEKEFGEVVGNLESYKKAFEMGNGSKQVFPTNKGMVEIKEIEIEDFPKIRNGGIFVGFKEFDESTYIKININGEVIQYYAQGGRIYDDLEDVKKGDKVKFLMDGMGGITRIYKEVPQKQKTENVIFRCDAETKEKIYKNAEEKGMTVSEYIISKTI